MTDYSKLLDPETITELYIHNLAKDSEGKLAPVWLKRFDPTVEDGELALWQAAEPLELEFEITLSVEHELGRGRCGTVFSTALKTVLEISNPDARGIVCNGPPYLPPVVLKVANSDNVNSLAREAMNYVTFEGLQGIAIPRCFGWFAVSLPEGWTYPGAYFQSDTEKYKDPQKRILTVLLLERLGDHLTLKETEDEIDDLRDVLLDMARKNMLHDDIRYDNICLAPSSPIGLPGKICPGHGRPHNYRVIDLESVTINDTLKVAHLIRSYHGELRIIYLPRRIAW